MNNSIRSKKKSHLTLDISQNNGDINNNDSYFIGQSSINPSVIT